MEEKKFIAFMFRTLLKTTFGNKSKMARTLGLPLRTLQMNFQHLDCAKGPTVAFEKLVYYCVENEIDIASLYQQYIICVKKGALTACNCIADRWIRPCWANNSIHRRTSAYHSGYGLT